MSDRGSYYTVQILSDIDTTLAEPEGRSAESYYRPPRRAPSGMLACVVAALLLPIFSVGFLG